MRANPFLLAEMLLIDDDPIDVNFENASSHREPWLVIIPSHHAPIKCDLTTFETTWSPDHHFPSPDLHIPYKLDRYELLLRMQIVRGMVEHMSRMIRDETAGTTLFSIPSLVIII